MVMMKQSRTPDATKEEHPTKRRLIEETTRRIMEDGLEAVNVDEVLAAVGVTKGSLYHHFGSVDDLMIAGLLHAFEAAIGESVAWSISLRDDCTTADEVRNRLHAIIDISQIPGRRIMRSVRMHALSMARTHPGLATEVARLQAHATNTMTGVIEELQRRGWSRRDIDPRALAVLIQAMNMGRIVDDVVEDADRVDSAAWIALYNDVLDRTFSDID